MESVGKSTNSLVQGFSKAREYMKEALTDASKMEKLKQYGITPSMTSNGQFGFSGDMDMILKTMLISSQTKGPGAFAGNQMMFRDMYGRPGADLLYKREQILQDPEESGIRKSELRQITELTSQFKILKESINLLVLEGITPFSKWLLTFRANRQDEKELDEKRQARHDELYTEKYGHAPSKSSALVNGFWDFREFIREVIGIPISEEEKSDIKHKHFDNDIIKQVSKELPDNYPRSAELDKRLRGISDTPQPPGDITSDIHKREFASNEFTKVGGLLGVDTSYRLSVLQVAQQQLDVSKDMAATLRSIDAKTMGAAMSVGAASSPFASMMVSTLASQADADSKPRTGSGPKGITWPNRAAERAAVLKASAAL
jgi:hypothetical protein